MAKFLAALLLSFAAFGLMAETVPARTVRIPSARNAGIGGIHVALADDLGTLAANPAGLYSVDSALYLAELTIGLSGPIFSIANLMIRAGGGESFAELISSKSGRDLLRGLYAGATLVGPVSFGYVGKGLGFSLINSGGMDFESIGSTTLRVGVYQKMVMNGGYAFRVPIPAAAETALDFGVNLKAFVQGRTEFEKSALEIPDIFSSGADAFFENPFALTTGIGMDLGMRYSPDSRFAVGMVARDVLTRTVRNDYDTLNGFLSREASTGRTLGFVPMDLTVGVMYRPEIEAIEQYVTGLTLALDYRDILDQVTHPATSINPILKLGFGVEAKVLEVLYLRAGVSEGLLTTGLGLDFGSVQVSAAMFGTELSAEPGLRPLFNIILGVQIRL